MIVEPNRKKRVTMMRRKLRGVSLALDVAVGWSVKKLVLLCLSAPVCG